MHSNPDIKTTLRGFSLFEILVAMVVLSMIVAMTMVILSGTNRTLLQATGHQAADEEARTVLDRMALDFAAMPRTKDLDTYFGKTTTGNGVYFYSRVAGYTANTIGIQSNLSLVGYRVNSSALKLEYLAYPAAWSDLVFLTHDTTVSTGYGGIAGSLLTPDAAPLASIVSSTNNFHVIGESVFRMDVCFFLKDGTISTLPVLSSTPSGWEAQNSSATFSATNQNLPPGTSNGAPTYAVGSRWCATDSTTGKIQGFICINDTQNQAVWNPIGWKDVNAIIVTIAVLDKANSTILHSLGKDLSQAASSLPAFTNGDTLLPMQTWTTAINSGALATSADLPKKISGAIRVYQRFYYLNSSNSVY
ncbi:MAG: type II secretion system protein J [Chthoniobacteraceae bacterium]